MDYVTRQFINLTKKFRKELRSALSLLNKNIEHQNTAIREAGDASKQRDNTPYILWTESKTAPSERYKQEAKDARDSIVKYWKAYAEIFGIVVIISYTVVTGLQLRETRRAVAAALRSANAAEVSNETSKIQFRSDERPFISPEPRGGYPNADKTWSVFSPDHKGMSVVIELYDRGRSPAVEITTSDTEYLIGPAEIVRGKAMHFVPQYAVTGSVMFPVGNSGNGMAPHSVVRPVSEEETKKWQNGTFDIYIVGGVRYRNMFLPRLQDSYETTYCYQLTTAGMPFANCKWKAPFFSNSIK